MSIEIEIAGQAARVRIEVLGYENPSAQDPSDANRIPEPKAVDLDRLMKTSPLIVGFRPLPSQNLINGVIRQQQQRGQFNQPNRSGPPGAQNPAPAPPPGPGHP